jgi:hypothetical protein
MYTLHELRWTVGQTQVLSNLSVLGKALRITIKIEIVAEIWTMPRLVLFLDVVVALVVTVVH